MVVNTHDGSNHKTLLIIQLKDLTIPKAIRLRRLRCVCERSWDLQSIDELLENCCKRFPSFEYYQLRSMISTLFDRGEELSSVCVCMVIQQIFFVYIQLFSETGWLLAYLAKSTLMK